MSTTDGPSVPGRTGNRAFLPVAVSTSSSFLSDMCERPCKLRGAFNTMEWHEPYTVAQRNQGNGGAARLLDDLEELPRGRLLVGIHRVDQLESFLLELVLGHVRRVLRQVGLVVGLHDLDAIWLGQRKLRRLQTSQGGCHRHHQAVD